MIVLDAIEQVGVLAFYDSEYSIVSTTGDEP